MAQKISRLVFAAVFNFVLPPMGYFLLGAWRTGIFAIALVAIVACLVFEFSVSYPPGVYALSPQTLRIAPVLLALALSGHAAWLATRTTPHIALAIRIVGGLFAIFMFVSLGFLVRAYWPVSVYAIESSSMQPTLEKGDIVAVKGARALCGGVRPEIGQVAIYMKSGSRPRYMQRVVAGPGQTVGFSGSALLIDGKKLVDRAGMSRIGEGPDGFNQVLVSREEIGKGRAFLVQHFQESPHPDVEPIQLKPGEYYFAGDNRDNALDSRYVGPVSVAKICGVAMTIVKSLDASRTGTQP